MNDWLSMVVLLVIVLGLGLLRESRRVSGTEKWIVSQGYRRRFPVPPGGPQPAAGLVASLSAHGARIWGMVLDGTLDGMPVTVAEHESAVSGQTTNVWFTMLTWPIPAAGGRIVMHRGTGPRALANTASAMVDGVKASLVEGLALPVRRTDPHVETPGGWIVYGDPDVRDLWLTPQKMRELDAWPHGGWFVRDDGHGAWRVQGNIKVANLEKLPKQFAAARHLMQG